MVVLTWEMGVERGMGIWGVERGRWGEMVIWGVERGLWGWWRGDLEGDGDLVGGDYDVEGHGDGDLGGWGSLPNLPSKESSGREWRGNWYYRGTWMLWRGGSGGVGIFA